VHTKLLGFDHAECDGAYEATVHYEPAFPYFKDIAGVCHVVLGIYQDETNAGTKDDTDKHPPTYISEVFRVVLEVAAVFASQF